MTTVKVSYEIKNLARWNRAAGNRAAFEAALRRRIREATALNAKLAEKAQRKVLQSGKALDPNAPLTNMIKGGSGKGRFTKGSKPGVDGGDLFAGITSRVVDDFTAFVGVLRTSKEYNVAITVHEGDSIAVTGRMRGMFFYLWKASAGELDPSTLTGRAADLWKRRPGGWKPLAESTSAIVIPGRPWPKFAFEDEGFKATVQRNWQLAVGRAFADLARGGA